METDDDSGPSGLKAQRAVPTAEAAHQNAVAFRDELLLLNWPNEKRMAEIRNSGWEDDSNERIALQRSNGSLLGVWVATEGTYRYPDFQFDARGSTRSEVAELLKYLPSCDHDPSGWRRAFWLYSPHHLLFSETPAHVFLNDPQRVIEAAIEEFCTDRNAHW